VLEEDYLAFRIGQVRRFGDALTAAGIPIVRPVGGHAVYLDAQALLPHLPPAALPAQALLVALYEEGAVRGVEIGSLMFGRTDPQTGREIHPELELVRLAVPRRVYTNSHLDYVVEAVDAVRRRAADIPGLAIVHAAPYLRHFTARLRRLAPSPAG
jgi:tryptophanase